MNLTDIQGLIALVTHKGWRTSEFLSFAVAALIFILSNFLEALQSIHITPETTLPVLIAAIIYGVQRSFVKRGAAGVISAAVAALAVADTTPVQNTVNVSPTVTTVPTPVSQVTTGASSQIASDGVSQAPIPPFAPDVVQ